MSTNWKTPTGADLNNVLATEIIALANKNTGAGVNPSPNAEIDTNKPTRADGLVLAVISEVRAAIMAGGTHPLSVTPDSVPPEAERHVWNMAAWQLINSTPNLPMAIITEGKVSSPLSAQNEKAEQYLASLRKAANVTPATDPTGQDYTTAVSTSNPRIKSVVWGDLYGTDEQYYAHDPTLQTSNMIAN